MDLRYVLLLIVSTSCVYSKKPPELHTDLTPEERVHYFGTEILEDVPVYEYTSPQKIDRRRRRDTKRSEGDQLEYSVHAFGELLHLILERNKDLISPVCVKLPPGKVPEMPIVFKLRTPYLGLLFFTSVYIWGCIVQRFKGNGTREVTPCSTEEVDCFYTGHANNNSDTWVAATVCGGMHGVIGLGERALVIQPIKDKHLSRAKRETSLEDPHIIYEYRHSKRSCSTHDHVNSETSTSLNRRRRKRSATRRYIETAVVADKSVHDFHGKETEKVLKAIINVVAQRLLDSTLGTHMYITINKIMILEEAEVDGLRVVSNSATTLTSLCQWQTSWNPADDSDPEHADYVLLLTKKDLAFNGNKANSGLARMGMCGRTGGCSVNEDAGLGAGLTIAHETGHVLGMDHDGEGNNCQNGVNIMSSMSPSGPEAFKWSSCSKAALQKFLSTSGSTCLNDAPPGSAIKSYNSDVKPGSLYTANKQCKLMIGPEAEVCEGVHANGQDVCGGLVCRPKPDAGVNGCVIYGMPRMDGTDCGSEAMKRAWCNQGSCVAMGPGSPEPRNGGWSDWEHDYHECSRSCGGGVKIKRRYCTNPEPMFGGSPCVGPNVVGEMCNVQPCSTNQFDFLAKQCAETNDRPIQGRKYQWEPNTGALDDDSCKVFCKVKGKNLVSKRGLSLDGSQCYERQPAAFSRCVSGQCKSFGCDGHMNSGYKYDTCGVCNGKGDTCRKITGTFKQGKPKDFTTFVTIPVGATGITITQANSYCYLSVIVKGEQLFKANAPHFSGIYTRGGVTITYQAKPERLEIVGPTESLIEAQVYRKYGAPYVGVDPDVYYEYHVPTTTQGLNYMWKTKAGRCTKSCGTGTQLPTITCEGPSGTVEDYRCNVNDKPTEFHQDCNTHACPPRWRTSDWSDCSKTCGGGQMTRTVDCVQENRNVETVLGAQVCQGQGKPSATAVCNTEHCPGTWKPGKWSSCTATCARGTRSREVKCYASASATTPTSDDKCIADDKPEENEYCLVKPCRTDIKGDACTDKQANCFLSYGEAVCTNQYQSWARANCMKSCGVCAENPSDYDPNCKDQVANCNRYTSGFCTNNAYGAWAQKNCKKFCGFCETEATTTTQATLTDPNCKDTVNCQAYSTGLCTEYAAWAKTRCKRFCNLCDIEEIKPEGNTSSVCKDTADCEAYGAGVCTMTEFAQQHCRRFCGLCQACDDVKKNCAAYGSGVCTKYKGWSKKNCPGFCGMCDTRKKRSAANQEEPPLQIELVPIVPEKVESPVMDEIADEPVTVADDVLDGAVEDVDGDPLSPSIVNEEGEFDGPVPAEPVCNTVRTEEKGTIDVFGKLVPGETCEQTIVLPLENKVLLKFKDIDVDCESGDVFTIIDGITNEEVSVCNSLLENEWLSSGSIVSLEFMAGKEGHGYKFDYEAYPQNETVPECSQHLEATTGHFSVIKFPMLKSQADEVCEIYITATPGESVQLTFTDFKMVGLPRRCDRDASVLVQDLVGGEEDEFCGTLSPFIWESNGARVRLLYRQSSVVDGFNVSYKVKDEYEYE